MDEQQMKIEALKEALGKTTVEYQEQIANLRVALTVTSNRADALQNELDELKASMEETDAEDEAE